jgi:DNA-binding IclR family transcriptional regulator
VSHVTSSAVKVLEALQHLCESENGLSLAELRALLDVSEATAYRAAQTLVATGFATVAASGKGYQPTLEVVRLGAMVSRQDHLATVLRTTFMPVNRQFQEPITIAIPDQDHILFIAKLAGLRDPDFSCDVGVRLPLHQGAAARAILAHLPEELAEHYLDQYAGSARERAHLAADGSTIRKLGFSFSRDEVDIGISAIGVPILNSSATVLAAAAIANVTARWTPEDVTERAEAMRAAAEEAHSLLLHLPSHLDQSA